MATAPLGADSASVIHPNRFPPAAAARVASRMLDRFNRDELGNAIEVLVTLLDVWDGDPDEEDDDPAEAAGDEKDAAWIEWHTMRGSQKRGPSILATDNEDDEDDDPAEEDDDSGQCTEDEISSGGGTYGWGGPLAAGCPISDPGIADSGALQEAHGYLSAPDYGDDQTQPLGPGHH